MNEFKYLTIFLLPTLSIIIPILSHPIPSYLILSHSISSYLILSHSIPSYPILRKEIKIENEMIYIKLREIRLDR
jgi:hypothetical protein